MTINLTPIIQAIITLLAALVTYRLIPWIKASTSEKERTILSTAVQIAVFAAEQIYGAGHGEQKLDYAVAWLHEQGFDVSRVEIEATVYDLINQYKKPPDEQ